MCKEGQLNSFPNSKRNILSENINIISLSTDIISCTFRENSCLTSLVLFGGNQLLKITLSCFQSNNVHDQALAYEIFVDGARAILVSSNFEEGNDVACSGLTSIEDSNCQEFTQPACQAMYFPNTLPEQLLISPTATLSRTPSSLPSREMPSNPSNAPVLMSSRLPTSNSPSLTSVPSIIHSVIYSLKPSNNSPMKTSNIPSIKSSISPSIVQSNKSSIKRSIFPTATLTSTPSILPSVTGTSNQSGIPSMIKSNIQINRPTFQVTRNPSIQPSISPTLSSTALPTVITTLTLSTRPSFSPSFKETTPSSTTSDHFTSTSSTIPTIASRILSNHPTRSLSYSYNTK